MTKAEFLKDLEEKLTGEVSPNTVLQNVSYYRDYIDSAIRRGQTEEEVLEELGSPFLIAKTIIDTNEIEETSYSGSAYEENGEEKGDQGESWRRQWVMDQKKTKWLIIGVLILVAVLFFTVLRLLLPVLLPVILVVFLLNLFRKK